MAQRRSIAVEFSGAGCGEGPLTWAQADHWRAIAAAGRAATFGGSFEMPPSFTVESAVELLRAMLGRHQALRTRLSFHAGEPRQVCAATGTVDLLVCEPENEAAEVLAQQLEAELRNRDFDYERDWPVRMAVVIGRDCLHLVVVYLHLALDGGAAAVLMSEFDAGGSQPPGPDTPVIAITPLEQAYSQSQPAALRTSAAAGRYFDHVFERVPAQLFGAPRRAGAPQYRAVRYRTPATRPALALAATRFDVPRSTVMLAAFAIGLARYRHDGRVWAMQLVSNRFRPGLADAVGILVQASPLLLELTAATVGQVVRLARSALLLSFKHAYYEAGSCDRARLAAGARRGVEIEVSCYYNDRLGVLPPDPGPLDTARLEPAQAVPTLLAQGVLSTDLSVSALPEFPLFFNVDSQLGVVEFPISYDARYFDADEIAGLARMVERAAVELALTPDRPVLS